MKYLSMILTERQNSVSEDMRRIPLTQLRQQLDPTRRPLHLAQHLRGSTPNIGIMAEWKRSSPSGGILTDGAVLTEHLQQYLWGGATAISVLTEPKWFGGSLTDLVTARSVIDRAERPVVLLRKDFIFNDYQILESAVAGADSLLLIVRLIQLIWPGFDLAVSHLQQLITTCREYGMEPLVEVCNQHETQVALAAGATVVGFNNRDLETLSVNPLHSVDLVAHLPDQVVPMVLSGINTTQAMTPYLQQGVRHFLVGTHLMLSDRPSRLLACLRRRPPLLKICGVTQIEEVEMLRRIPGVAMLGLVFAEGRHSVVPEFAEGVRHHLGGSAYRWHSHQTEPLVAEIANAVATLPRPLLVGVFSYQTTAEINRIATQVGLDLIQLHGPDQSEARSTDFVVPVIRSIGITPQQATETSQLLLTVEQVRQRYPLVLFDTQVSGKLGGTGESFPLYHLYSFRRHLEFGMAGGIVPEKIPEIRQRLCPWCIDISSGVEQLGVARPMKDPIKVREAVRACQRPSVTVPSHVQSPDC